MSSSATPRGCTFLTNPVGTEEIFSPEKFTRDQRMFAQTAADFMEKEVHPHIDRLEHSEPGLMVEKLKKAGDVGLLMIDIPEEYGGLDLDKTTSMLCAERMGTYGSFSVSHGAHTGIGSLPLIFFGNDEQKARYLPRLATGELLAAYALTEPGSGSDALGAKTTAVRVTGEDGKLYYRLNGSKMWITNAGFADLFTVFAKVDGSQFTAFLVERGYRGFSTGAEEKKMGLKGSSTRALVLEDVLVPEENVLGEVGRGHKIAFNILNVGRFKLGVGVLGACKQATEIAAAYARERKQFDQPIANFGAMREKFAEMAIRTYALESMCYRVAGYMDTNIGGIPKGPDYAAQVTAAIEEFAIEDSIMKVYGSETIGFAVDEAVQIHGGYGYSQEYAVERGYRDSRINRIFEGTNEINRMLIPGMVLKRTMKGELPLFDLVQKVEQALGEEKEVAPAWDASGLAHEMFLVEKTKELTVHIANLAIRRHTSDFKEQQELMLALADMFIACYGADCTVARVQQLLRAGTAAAAHLAIAHAFASQCHQQAQQIGFRLLPSLCEPEKLGKRQAALEKLSYRPAVDLVGRRRVVAQFVLDNARWSL